MIVNKPSGPTSHDIVAQARRLFKTRAIGHAGTLDPMASGVLLLLVGEATKLSSALTLDQKSYRATVRFGTATDSDDAMGTPIAAKTIEPGWLEPRRLENVLEQERHRDVQIPPQVSAIKHAGVAAYRRQRRGESMVLAARSVHVHELNLLSATDEVVELFLSVSKGYYVRSLARDIGDQLSMPAHLTALCRTSSGCFRLEEAVDWPCCHPPRLMPLGEVVRRSMPTWILAPEGVRRARLGQLLLQEHFVGCEPSEEQRLQAWLDEAGELVALGRRGADGTYQVARGFNATG